LEDRRRWEDNIKMDITRRGWGVMEWIDMAQDEDTVALDSCVAV
jgi:hypothetical protein